MITPTTSTTVIQPTTSTRSTTSSTTSTTCIPLTSCPGGTQCGAVDDGCGGTVPCGTCPAQTPVCVEGSCHESCFGAADLTPCDKDGSLCTTEQCYSGKCETTGFTTCLVPKSCYTQVACDPGTGTCVSDGYVGDGETCGGVGAPLGVCAFGSCQTGKACLIDGVLHESGDLNPDFECTACQPGYDPTAWTPVTDGIACETGFCVGGGCFTNVCVSGLTVFPIGSANPDDPCQTCQLGPAQKAVWAPLPNGTACDGGICLSGSCNTASCLIDGVVYPDGASEFFFSHGCHTCNVSKSRSAWTSLSNGSPCGCGGFCNNGTCGVVGQPACGGTDCRIGNCNQDGTCHTTPINVGGPCSEPSANGCTATIGTCDASGTCVRTAFPGKLCTPPPDSGVCQSKTTGKCEANGACRPDDLLGAECIPPGGTPALCTVNDGVSGKASYSCIRIGSPTAPATCNLTGFHACADVPEDGGCAYGSCDPATGECRYGPYPTGTRLCEDLGGGEAQPCCPGQVCTKPPFCDACFGKYCYYN